MANNTQRQAYLVLGMHRSGTSAVTQFLALAGANLPRNVMPGDEHNTKGYFEPWKVAMFNDRRLRESGGAWDDIFAFPYRPLPRKLESQWRRDALSLFEAEFDDARHPLLKDPRVTVLMPLWRPALEDLEVELRCVIPVRHPLAVAGSLARRNGFPVEKSVLLWTSYMLAAEAYSRDLPRAFVSYDALLDDWRAEASRIETAFGAPLPALNSKAAKAIDGFLTADLRHNGGDGDLAAVPGVGALVERVHRWFVAAAHGKAPARRALDEAAAELAHMQAVMGVLVSPVTRDLDAARAELQTLRQQQAYDYAQRQALEQELAVVSELVESMLASD